MSGSHHRRTGFPKGDTIGTFVQTVLITFPCKLFSRGSALVFANTSPLCRRELSAPTSLSSLRKTKARSSLPATRPQSSQPWPYTTGIASRAAHCRWAAPNGLSRTGYRCGTTPSHSQARHGTSGALYPDLSTPGPAVTCRQFIRAIVVSFLVFSSWWLLLMTCIIGGWRCMVGPVRRILQQKYTRIQRWIRTTLHYLMIR